MFSPASYPSSLSPGAQALAYARQAPTYLQLVLSRLPYLSADFSSSQLLPYLIPPYIKQLYLNYITNENSYQYYILPSITSRMSLQFSGCLNTRILAPARSRLIAVMPSHKSPCFSLCLACFVLAHSLPRSAIMGICMVLSPNMTPMCLVLSIMVKLYSMP